MALLLSVGKTTASKSDASTPWAHFTCTVDGVTGLSRDEVSRDRHRHDAQHSSSSARDRSSLVFVDVERGACPDRARPLPLPPILWQRSGVDG